MTASLVIGGFFLLGLGILFSRATNIERPALVGGLTLLGSVIGGLWLRTAWIDGGPTSWIQIIGVISVPVISYSVARVVDRLLGDRPIDPERDEKTLGAHLSD